MSRQIKVQFTTSVPEEATDEQILEWLRMELSGGGMANDNPCEGDVNACWSSVEFE